MAIAALSQIDNCLKLRNGTTMIGKNIIGDVFKDENRSTVCLELCKELALEFQNGASESDICRLILMDPRFENDMERLWICWKLSSALELYCKVKPFLQSL